MLLNRGRRLLANYRRSRQVAFYRRQHVGENTRISRRAQIYGWKNVRFGAHCVICEETLINAFNLPSDGAVLTIGSYCFIGRRNFFTAGPAIHLGDYSFTGPDCQFLGADHIYETPLAPYIATGCTGQTIRLGVNCWLGARVTVLKGVEIGHGSVIGACSVVTRDVPPFSVAIGTPARVVQRFDFLKNAWIPAGDLTPEAAAQMPAEAEYLAALRRTHPSVRMPFDGIGREVGDR